MSISLERVLFRHLEEKLDQLAREDYTTNAPADPTAAVNWAGWVAFEYDPWYVADDEVATYEIPPPATYELSAGEAFGVFSFKLRLRGRQHYTISRHIDHLSGATDGDREFINALLDGFFSKTADGAEAAMQRGMEL